MTGVGQRTPCQSKSLPREILGVLKPDLPARLANEFVAYEDPAFDQHFLDFSEAQRDSRVQSDRVADDLS